MMKNKLNKILFDARDLLKITEDNMNYLSNKIINKIYKKEYLVYEKNFTNSHKADNYIEAFEFFKNIINEKNIDENSDTIFTISSSISNSRNDQILLNIGSIYGSQYKIKDLQNGLKELKEYIEIINNIKNLSNICIDYLNDIEAYINFYLSDKKSNGVTYVYGTINSKLSIGYEDIF
jgi:hypothetical protein